MIIFINDDLLYIDMVEDIILACGFGALGGFVRGLVGVSKAISAGKKIIWHYWLITVAIAMIVGIFTVTVIGFDVRYASLIGYAGTDFLEGMTKAWVSKKGFEL